jgi:hypothetical protein
MPVGQTIVFARIIPAELDIVTNENNNIIDLALVRQMKTDSTTPQDIWQNKFKQSATSGIYTSGTVLCWRDFVDHFYGGGYSDFGVSQVAGRQITMIGVSGEYVNGVPQGFSSLTHLSDRAKTNNTYSGCSVLNDVIDSVSYDLGLPAEAWDSCSYNNVVEQLNDIHSLGDVCRVKGGLQKTCALSMHQLVHEICNNYDENSGMVAVSADSATWTLYNEGADSAIEKAMAYTLDANTSTNASLNINKLHDLVLSIMFKNSTPGVRNVEFRIHFLTGLYGNTLMNLCAETNNLTLAGTQV